MHQAQETKLLALSQALALRNVKFRLLAGVRAPNIKLLDQSWVFYVTNVGRVNATPASGKILQFAEDMPVQSILQQCRVECYRLDGAAYPKLPTLDRTEDQIMPNFEVEITVTEVKTIRTSYTYRVPCKAKNDEAACEKMQDKLDSLEINELADLPSTWVEQDRDEEEEDSEWEFDVSSAEEIEE